MLVELMSTASRGLESVGVTVEVNLASKSFPAFNIVGLPNKAIDEAKERVRTALVNSGVEFPQKRITVNLAPADLPKAGSCYDLPMAVGIASLVLKFELPKEAVFYGELSLNGKLRHTHGVFLAALWAKEKGIEDLFVPADSVGEAAVIPGVRVWPVRSLGELISHLAGRKKIMAAGKINLEKDVFSEVAVDFEEIVGQEQAKRAMEIAAAGGHNILLNGVPGTGKTMLSKALAGILPPLSWEESLAVSKIYSVAGMIEAGGTLVVKRPFRSPHHNVSKVGLVGGGAQVLPGEISLAHRGVLFLDELPEFSRNTLEALRQPLEDGVVTISRAAGRVTYPAQFILVASANPCPCGYFGHPKKKCQCSMADILRYRRRLSGPLLDRIDLQITVPPVEVEKLSLSAKVKRLTESSVKIRARVVLARQRQAKRFEKEKILLNAEMGNKQMKKYCLLSNEGEDLLRQAVRRFGLSTRAYFRLIKVARTIADLAGEENISAAYLAEALQYREQG